MRELYADPCATVHLDPDTGVIRFTRTEVPYASNAEMAAIHAQIGRIFDHHGRARYTLLVDMRRAVMNNDPAFEQAAQRARAILVRGFPRVAVLVQTAVGALQVKRHVQHDGLSIPVLSSEPLALEFLLEKAEDLPPPSSINPTRGEAASRATPRPRRR
ncbi:hypothetical protein A7982_12150 [Minicystis rosea]|nr:hypothetical protein A7982_12150 [Minicystis rosea]